jgi:hypothetical protein
MLGAAGLTFGIAAGVPALPGATGAHAQAVKSVALNAWVTLDTDGTVTILSPASEMGQGSRTALPVIIADAMDADWPKVKIVPAPPRGTLYGNPAFGGEQYTAGSATVRGYFDSLRRFGEQVRYVLMDNAARHWRVPLEEITTQPGAVLHVPSGRRIAYGDIAAFATIPAQAPEVAIEPVEKAHFRLIGKDVSRVDVAGKTKGAALYSIDVQGTRHGLWGDPARAGRRCGARQRGRLGRARHRGGDRRRAARVWRGRSRRQRRGQHSRAGTRSRCRGAARPGAGAIPARRATRGSPQQRRIRAQKVSCGRRQATRRARWQKR